MFPANCVSDSPNATRILHEEAEANAMIAQAEDILFTARRQPSEVAILYPRSSEMWDGWVSSMHVIATGLCSWKRLKAKCLFDPAHGARGRPVHVLLRELDGLALHRLHRRGLRSVPRAGHGLEHPGRLHREFGALLLRVSSAVLLT